MTSRSASVVVETAARLHFGVLDLRGSYGRWFGGIGAAAPGPRLKVSVRPAPSLEVVGPDAERAAEFASRFLAAHGISNGARVEVQRALPAHSGLGSGTQLALAVSQALAGLFGIDVRAPELARAVGRARRSAVGTWTFDGGGLVVEGGRPRHADAPGPLLARLPFPRSWECVVVIPEAHSTLSGDQEEAAFARLPEPSLAETHEVAHLVIMSLLPSVLENDITAFGYALTRIQEITGGWFAAAQGGTFQAGPTARVIQRMRELQAPGVGQSSWGPAAYAIVDGAEAAARIEADVVGLLAGKGQVFRGAFPHEGARVWREP